MKEYGIGDVVVYIGPRSDMQGLMYIVNSDHDSHVGVKGLSFGLHKKYIRLATPLERLL